MQNITLVRVRLQDEEIKSLKESAAREVAQLRKRAADLDSERVDLEDRYLAAKILC